MRAGRAEKAPKSPEARGRTYERARPAPKPETPGLRTPLKLPDPVTLRAEERPLPPGLRAHLAKIIDPAAAYAATAHSGEASNEIARAYDARAVAIGKDIFFARGQLRFDTSDAINLIAHEVVHVAQALAGLLDRPAAKADTAPAAGPHEGAANAKAAAAVAPPKGEKKGAEGKGAEKAPAAKGEKPAGPAAKGEAGAGVAAGEAKAPPREPGEPIMPEPPKELSAAEKARIAHVEGKAEAAKEAQANVPKAGAEVETTQAAVQQPKAEADAKARGDLVTTLDDRPPPSPEIEQLCDKIRKVIRDKRPPDEDSLVDADPKAMAKAAGEEQNKQVKGDVDRVSGEYDAMQASPSGTPEPKPPDMTPTPAKVASPDIGAPAATPDKVPPQKVSLDADVEAGNKQIEDAGMNTEPAKLVEDGPIAEARGAQGDLADMAKKDPEKVLAEQNAKLAQASAGMKSLQQRTAAALAAARAAEVGKAETQKKAAKKSEEDLRAELGDKAKQTFKTAQDAVKDALKDVPDTAMAKWDAGVDKLSTQFKNTLNKVAAWIKDRHSGVGGFFLGIGDAIAGLPDWVTDEYDRAEQEFGDGVCALIEDISRDVNAVIKTCDDIIAQARKDIAKIFTEDIPDGLKDWAAQQEKDFGAKLDNLSKEVTQTKADFNKDLINRASQAVQDARAEIHDLREAAKGLIGKLKDAINEFLDDPVKFIINGLLKLLGIPPSAFWAVVAKIKQVISDIADDPLGFANNLMAGVSKGFSQFFDNIARHLLEGFLDWLFSGMRKEGMSIEVPREISLKSVITFFLSLLGISWARIRKLLVEQLGEKTVAILEKAAGIIYTLVTKGISGIFEEIAQFLEPQTIVDAIVDAAIKYLIETLIVKVTVRIIAMLNPAGAILAALEAIYRVLKWIFNNAARIFHLVEAVVDAMADVIAGNIGGVANAVEKALAMLIPPVIDFLADYLGLGGLPKKIADAVKGLQDMVERVLRKVVAWLVAQGRKLLAALGIKGKDKDKEKKGDEPVGETVPFSGGGESHKLYFVQSGENATLMVASTPQAYETRLNDFQARANGTKGVEFFTDHDEKAKALKLIQAARDLGVKSDHDADVLVRKHKKAQEGGEDASEGENKSLTDEEKKLAAIFAELYEMFGEHAGDEKLDMRESYSGDAGSGELSFKRPSKESKVAYVMASGPVSGHARGASSGRLALEAAALQTAVESQKLVRAPGNVVKAISELGPLASKTEEGVGKYLKSTSKKKPPQPPPEALAPFKAAAGAASTVASLKRIGAGEIVERATSALAEEHRGPGAKAVFSIAAELRTIFAAQQEEARAKDEATKDDPNAKKASTTTIVVPGGGPLVRTEATRTKVNQPFTPGVVTTASGPRVAAVDTYEAIKKELENVSGDFGRKLVGILHELLPAPQRKPKRLRTEFKVVRLTKAGKERTFTRDVDQLLASIAVLFAVEMARATTAWTYAVPRLIKANTAAEVAAAFNTDVFPHAQEGFVANYASLGPTLFDPAAVKLLKDLEVKFKGDEGLSDKTQVFMTVDEVKDAVKAVKDKLAPLLENKLDDLEPK